LAFLIDNKKKGNIPINGSEEIINLCIKSALVTETRVCRERIDFCKIEAYILETAKIYVNLYPWIYAFIYNILVYNIGV